MTNRCAVLDRLFDTSQSGHIGACDLDRMQDTRLRELGHTPMSAAIHRQVNDPAWDSPCVDVVVPVFNEAATLGANISSLRAYLSERFPFTWRITIVDNASTDGTWYQAARFARDAPHIRALHLDRKGRGLALRSAWAESDAEIVAYMDVDLSTDLDALLPLVAPLVSGHSDIAIGSRLARGSSVARGPKRELISRCYNAILRAAFATSVRDAQCGFKAVRADVARRLLPYIEDNSWFFDTELLLLAEHNGLRIHEVPVDWVDDLDSRVRVARTAVDDLRGTVRMLRRFAAGRGSIDLGALERRAVSDDFGRRFVSFALIGMASTAISLALFLALRVPIGAVAANLVAVTATFVANTWAHARHLSLHGRPRWARAFGVYVGSLALTSGALALVVIAGGGLVAQLATLVATWSLATLARFVVIGGTR
jgi:glycosyltransferase involved in cell wall biosynthesis